MNASAAAINRVRRMIAETSPTSVITDEAIAEAIIRHPIVDARGEPPYLESSTDPAALVENPTWMPTFDLHHAAADLWEEKAAAVVGHFDFSADGGNYTRSQVYAHCMRMAKYHLARRMVTTVTQTPAAGGEDARERFQ